MKSFSVIGSGKDGTPPNQVSRFLDWLEARSVCRLLPNPFDQPPAAIVSGGMWAVKGFFEAILKDEVPQRRDLKAVIIGAAGSGKTR